MVILYFCLFLSVLSFKDLSTFRARCVLPVNLDLYDLTKISFPVIKKTNKRNTVIFDLCGTTSAICDQTKGAEKFGIEDDSKKERQARASSYIKVGKKCFPLIKAGVIPSVSASLGEINYYFPDQEDSYSIKRLTFTCDPNAKLDEFSKLQIFEIKKEIFIRGESKLFCDQNSFGSIDFSTVNTFSWVFFVIGNVILFTGILRIDLTIGYLLVFAALMQYTSIVYLVDKSFLFSGQSSLCVCAIGVLFPMISYFSPISFIFRLMGASGLFGLVLGLAFFASPFIPVNYWFLAVLLGLGSLVGFILGGKYNFTTVIFSTVITGIYWVVIGSNAFVESPLILLLELSSSQELNIIWEQISLDYIRILIIVLFESSISVLIQIIELRHTYQKENATRQSFLLNN